MKSPFALLTWLLLSVVTPAPGLEAIEPWADTRLPHHQGLELWLDGTRLEASAGTETVAVWRDGSGKARRFFQGQAKFRPTVRSGRNAIRLDGVDDFLEATGPEEATEELTLWMVAAARSNSGFFRAAFAGSGVGKNDYTHGINVDLGAAATQHLDCLNVEGQGVVGQSNLLSEPLALGQFHILCVTSRAGRNGVTLFVNGKLVGSRERSPGRINLQRLFLGARYYSNTAAPPTPSGFFDGEIAEVIAYSRALPDDERAAVFAYLRDKHAALLSEAGPPPPPPQPLLRFLVPGFRVDELPVSLTNVTDLAYLPDARLLTLGYNGRIHVLQDSDGDGLEDATDVYWTGAPFEQAMAMALGPQGLFVASRGKISLLRDSDQDGRPDEETIAARDWEMAKVSSGGGIDVMGLAVDAKGFVYFGIGCDDFTNPYLLRDGQANFRRGGERGTIQKLWPDFSRREAICDGIRFSYNLAFNAAGDLFATDQEGETWCPQGNPLDELNHIQPGRYYGFPPEHPTYLPNVPGETPVAEFGPQHQSTCGLLFNEPAPGGKAFGPTEWAGDAFVAGYSRGKLWRVALTRTAQGNYVSLPSLVASARMLLLELALAPDGAVVIACHSGAPDWGTGPGGSGKLFKARFVGSARARAVLAWAQGPVEARVTFDRPLGPQEAAEIGAGARIVQGPHARAGDRFELLRPGYASVAAQMAQPATELRVTGARLAADGQTIILATDPHPVDGTYAVTLPAPGEAPGDLAVDNDLAYSLDGVDAQLVEAGTNTPAWAGWLPHQESAVARHFTRGSIEHDRLWNLLTHPQQLRLKPRQPRPQVSTTPPAPRVVPELAGGDWRRGEAVYFSAEAKCSACHTLRGRGGRIGPDLSNLVHRDAASVLQDLEKPSAAIHPDHAGYTVVLVDGRVLSGLLQSDGTSTLRIFDSNAQETRVDRKDVGSIEPMTVSVMPEGLTQALGPARLKDLLAYLLFAAPDDGARTLGAMHVILVAGPKDHGPGEHDYPAWQNQWLGLLNAIPGVRAEGAWQWPSPGQWRRADLAVFFFWNHDWNEEQYRELDHYLARGGGAVAIHSAVIPPREPEKLASRWGLAWVPGKTKFRHGALEMRASIQAGNDDPILAGIKSLSLTDEIYWPLGGDASGVKVLLETEEEGAWRPMAWTFTPPGSKGRVFTTLLGHYAKTFDNQEARGIFLRGMAWAGNFAEDWDRLLERSVVEAEAFRHELLSPRPGSRSNAALVADAINKFLELAARRDIETTALDGFKLSTVELEAAMAGSRRIDPGAAFGSFAGTWHGLWDKMPVDHHWGGIVTLEPPASVAGTPTQTRAWQFAWVGDGYGLNLVTTAGSDASRDVILGYVVHLKDGDRRTPTRRRPHVGVHAGTGRLIWITAGEVFLERALDGANGESRYAITGFRYQINAAGLDASTGFQAIYGRDSAVRAPWKSFEVNLQIR